MRLDLDLVTQHLRETDQRRLGAVNPPIPDPRSLNRDQVSELLLKSNSLLGFSDIFWPALEPDRKLVAGWHVGCVAEHLEEVSRPQSMLPNLIINVPPRCMKSMLVCVLWFAHVWRKRPATRWMYSSFAQDLVRRDSERCRLLVKHPLYKALWGLEIKDSQDTQLRFTNTAEGFRYAVTVGGQGMGEGADFIVVDDPINPKKARSAIERANVIRWWRSTMSMRSNDPANVRKIIIMQRLHEQDLTGYLVSESLGWEHLVLPMRYEPRRYILPDPPSPEPKPAETVQPTDLKVSIEAAIRAFVRDAEAKAAPRDAIRPTKLQLARPSLMDGSEESGRDQEGDLLWPERMPAAVVEQQEAELGEDAPGQLQQRPSAEKGEIFEAEHFRRFDILYREDGTFGGVKLYGPNQDQVRSFAPERLTWWQCIDTALTESARSAFTAVGTFCSTDQYDLLVWNMFRAKLEVQYQFDVLKVLKAGPAVWDRKTRKIISTGAWPGSLVTQAIEPKASGIGLIQQGASEGNYFHTLKVDGDKVQRAAVVARMYTNHKVYHPQPTTPWVIAAEDELLTFPNGTYKDVADVIAYGGLMLTHDKIIRAVVDRPMADTGEAEGIPEDQRPLGENEMEFMTAAGPMRIEWPDDDDADPFAPGLGGRR